MRLVAGTLDSPQVFNHLDGLWHENAVTGTEARSPRVTKAPPGVRSAMVDLGSPAMVLGVAVTRRRLKRGRGFDAVCIDADGRPHPIWP